MLFLKIFKCFFLRILKTLLRISESEDEALKAKSSRTISQHLLGRSPGDHSRSRQGDLPRSLTFMMLTAIEPLRITQYTAFLLFSHVNSLKTSLKSIENLI